MKKIYLVLFALVVTMMSCSKYNKQSSTDVPSPSKSIDLEFYPGEIKPESFKTCFKGAYYRKLVSSFDKWVGIRGKVVLPEIYFDEGRRNPNKPGQYLDNPSIYLGGNMNGQETDIGLTWEVIKDDKGVVSNERKAYRPFLRRTSFIATKQDAVYENGPAQKEYYWYPGEEVDMYVKVIAKGKLLFVIEGAGKKFEKEFSCDGYGLDVIGEFKRVNAIDQVGNEGKPVQLTQTKVLNAIWKSTNLYRMENGHIIETPFHKGRYTEMACPLIDYFQINSTDNDRAIGAELINISGSKF